MRDGSSGRGGRPRLRRLLAAAVLPAALITGLPLAASAAPARPAPRVAVVGGHRTVTAAWTAVPSASGYAVRLDSPTTPGRARRLVTTARTARFSGLVDGRVYRVSVTPRTGGLAAETARSTRVRAIAAGGFPLPVEHVTAIPGPAQDQVTVRWRGGGRAVKVAVVAGANATADRRSFHSAWQPATTRTITITVPPRYRALMGGATGNPVWVKVVQSNSGSQAFGAMTSVARGYRATPAGVRTQAGPAQVQGDVSRLVVGELNVQSAAATERFGPENRWAARVDRLARAIDTASRATTGVGKPQLLLTSELTTKVLGDCTNHPSAGQPYRCASRTQLADLARRLPGLRLADDDAYDRVLDRGRLAPAWAGRVTHGAHVFYDPAVLTVLDHGFYSPAMRPDEGFADVEGLGVPGWTLASVGPDRWLSWAELEMKDSGRRFYAVAVHLPAGSSPAVVAARQQTAERLAAAVSLRSGGLPVVLGGDMNGDGTSSAAAAQTVLVRHGFVDAATAPVRIGATVNTANLSGPQAGDPGYGGAPVRHRYDTSRIDFILLLHSPHAYRFANVLRLRTDGAFRRDLQGTDHNMQLAEVGIAGPGR